MSGGSNAELRMVADRWILTGDPYVIYRAELAVPFSERHENGALSWAATDEVATELMWFKQRFSFHCRHELLLRRDMARHSQTMLEAKRVISGKYEPGSIQFRDGLEPREYQKPVAMLWRTVKNLLCADEVGLGKTISGIAGIADEKMLPAVVVAPSNLTIQWKNQIERFLPALTTHIITRERNYDLKIVLTCSNCGEVATSTSAAIRKCRYCKHGYFERSLADVYLVSYHLAHHWCKALGLSVKSVIYDECQEIRRSESKKYDACKHLSSKAEYRLGLSATPVQNYGGEMWNIMDVLTPRRLGSKYVFRNTWCSAPTGQNKEHSLKDPQAFGKFLIEQGMMIRRTRKDVGRELPDEQRIIHSIDYDSDEFSKLTKDARELARVIMRLTDKQLMSTDEFTAASKFRKMMYKATGVSKAPYVAEFVKLLLESGEPVMLFGWHRDVYEIWCKQLRDYKPLLYTGSEDARVKEHNKQQFMAGKSNLLICSLKSGVGLDGIQDRCKIGVIGELDWSPAVITQCVGRYHRDGQADPCLTYMMISEAGLDPYMIQTLGIKRLQVDGVVLQEAHDNVLDSVDAAKHIRELAQKLLAA